MSIVNLTVPSSGYSKIPGMIQDGLAKLYYTFFNSTPERIERLSAAGSNREYFRLYGTQTVIGVYGNSPEENQAFVYLSSFFKKNGIPVPEVYLFSANHMLYLQEDLGDVLLFDAIAEGRQKGLFNSQEKKLLNNALELLPAIQYGGRNGLDYSWCYPQPSFNRRSIFWDLHYFKYCFLKTSGLEFQEDKLEDDFEEMAALLLEEPFDTFMYRDFQSRNVMVKENQLHLIDFQGGRKGPVYYDVASFLWQAKANYPDDLREELIECYLKASQPYTQPDEKKFREKLKHFVLFRTLQVLGAYGFRGGFEKKPHFIESIPFALNNLKHLLNQGFTQYNYLVPLLTELSETGTNIKE